MVAASFQPRFMASLEAGVESLSAERRMNVSGVAGQQHAALAIGRRLTRTVGIGGGDMDGLQCHVRAGDVAQHRLQGFERDLLGAIEGRVIEVDHADAVRARDRGCTCLFPSD